MSRKRRKLQPRMPKHWRPPPAYAQKVLQHAAPLLQRGTVVEVEVRHDDWCDLLNRRGECNCTPHVRTIGHHGGYGQASGRN